MRSKAILIKSLNALIVAATTISLSAAYLLTNPANTHALSATITQQDFRVPKGGSVSGTFSIQNTTDTPVDLTILAASYNPQSQTLIDDNTVNDQPTNYKQMYKQSGELEVSFSQDTINNLEPGAKADIGFTVKVSELAKSRSFYFIIYALPESITTSSGSVGIFAGAGQVIGVHPFNDNELQQDFRNNNFTLEVVDRGIPFVKDTQVKVTFTNTSDYVYLTTGEVRIFHEDILLDSFRMESLDERLYPGESIKYEFSTDKISPYSIWYENEVIGRMYNQYNDYIEARDSIKSYRTEILTLGSGTALIVLGLFYIKVVQKRKRIK